MLNVCTYQDFDACAVCPITNKISENLVAGQAEQAEREAVSVLSYVVRRSDADHTFSNLSKRKGNK